MNKNKFKKVINYEIKDNTLSCHTLINLIENDKKSLFNNKDIIDLVADNFEIIIKNCSNIYYTVKTLNKYEGLKEIVEKHFTSILSLCDNNEISDMISNNIFDIDINSYINDNFEAIINNNTEGIYSLYFINRILKLTEENLSILNEHISNNMKLLVEISLKPYFRCFNHKNKDYNSLISIIAMLINELCDVECVRYTDIEFGNSGTFTNTIIIGSKVLKISDRRFTYHIPNNMRILKPLIRVNLEDYSDIKGVIEVANKVDTNVNLSNEELYILYKELRKRKIVFTDLKNENLGYLLKDNNYNWGKQLSDILESRGLFQDESIALKKGEIVIIDTDFIYQEDDPNIVYASSLSKSFECDYQKEIREKIKR